VTDLLDVADLVIDYAGRSGRQRAVDGASLRIGRGESVGVVGESGSGKSTLAAAVGRLLPASAEWVSGSVRIGGEELRDMPAARLRAVRKERLGYVFQDPIASLDPTMRVGAQLGLLLGRKPGSPEVATQLREVRLTDTARIARSYPHQLSGGMAQRVAIAMALARKPELLVADEPTAALDTQVREEVLQIIFALAAGAGTSIMMLSHDLLAVGRYCARIAVMYAGRVVEDGATAEVLAAPSHPYTVALLEAMPSQASRGTRLAPIPGQPPALTGAAQGCAFAPRCAWAIERCTQERPVPVTIGSRSVVCHRADEVANASAPENPRAGVAL
jgi:oligopeptide/dipeptide ABC transporter ATP-binding protein